MVLLCPSTHQNDCAVVVWEKDCCCFRDFLIKFGLTRRYVYFQDASGQAKVKVA